MTDPRTLARAYLEQQRRPGGDTVVRSHTGPAEVPASAAPPAVPAAGPAVPPPGTSWEPPASTDLFTADPVREATSLEGLAALVAACTKCRLCESRARTVPGGKSIACSSPAAIAWDPAFANAADPSGRAVAGVHLAAT